MIHHGYENDKSGADNKTSAVPNKGVLTSVKSDPLFTELVLCVQGLAKKDDRRAGYGEEHSDVEDGPTASRTPCEIRYPVPSPRSPTYGRRVPVGGPM